MSYEAFETIKIDVDGALAVVTVAREPALNALSSQVIAELTAACGELEVSTDVRAVIVTGAGDKAFVAGADIAEMRDLTPRQGHAFAQMGGALGASIESSEKPWIAAVNGFALGGGCELALACDVVLAADTARFGQPEVNLGVIPGFGGTQRLARRVGWGKANELLFTGDAVKADEALRTGLCDAVVPLAELPGRARALADKIAGKGPLAIAAIKRVRDAGLPAEAEAFAALFETADQREGMEAFLAKRAPRFEGK